MQNPYQAPQAHVEDVSAGGDHGTLIEGGRKVDAGNATSWIGGGWTLFKQAPGIWIANFIIFFVILMVAGLIPFLSIVLQPIATALLMGGIMLGCRALDDGEPYTVGHLFAGLQQHTTPLLVIGVIQLVLSIVMMIGIGVLAMILLGGSLLAGGGLGALSGGNMMGAMMAGGFGISMIILIVLAMLLGLAVYSAILFAPALVVLHNLAPMDAVKASFSGFWKNFVGFLLWGILAMVLTFVGMIPIGLGLLVVSPMLMGSIYAAYKDIYLEA